MVNKIQIREYTSKDKLKVLRCVRKIKTEFGWWPVDKKYAQDLYDIPGHYMTEKGKFLLLTRGNAVIGTCGLQDMNEKRGYLRRLYLSKKFRGQGFGKKIFAEILQHAEIMGYKHVFLASDPHAKAALHLYKEYGFVPVQALPDDFGTSEEPFYQLSMNETK